MEEGDCSTNTSLLRVCAVCVRTWVCVEKQVSVGDLDQRVSDYWTGDQINVLAALGPAQDQDKRNG